MVVWVCIRQRNAGLPRPHALLEPLLDVGAADRVPGGEAVETGWVTVNQAPRHSRGWRQRGNPFISQPVRQLAENRHRVFEASWVQAHVRAIDPSSHEVHTVRLRVRVPGIQGAHLEAVDAGADDVPSQRVVG